MLGGGNFVTQNKILPGSYINFVSSDMGVNVFGERGVVALGCVLDWADSGITEITKEDFINNSKAILGYEYTNYRLIDIREVFKNAKKLLLYNICQTDQSRASCDYCTANKWGSRGNSLMVSISTNVDNNQKKDVNLYLDKTLVFSQTVSSAIELKNNSYVSWKTSADLTNTAGTYLTNGKNGSVTGDNISTFLKLLESRSFNAVGIVYDSIPFEELLIEYTKRMRDEVGKKFQCVTSSAKGDYEGNVYVSAIVDEDDYHHIIPWVTGAIGSCAINKSLTNTIYNGEYTLVCRETQASLESSVKNGVFKFHNVNGEARVLLDINALTTTTAEKGEDFKDNQTVRLCDQIAMDTAEIFNSYYLGKVPNDSAGRNSLWCDIVKHHQTLKDIRAIDDFDENNITVKRGESKRSVVITDCITPANAMTQLYMTVTIE
ncbi:MAG: phage tail sheath C-terminal domain-containing protein [Clostridia bacterium]|nr:phage tail sheath C-terminal domain-containing protein [Clostridia bacterium]